MDVWRAAGVWYRLDGAEVVFAGRSGQEATEALKILVALLLLAAGISCVDVHTLVVALPDFDEGVAHRITLGVEDAARQMRDLADGRGDRVVDDEQVVVGVERQFVGVEWSLGLRWRADPCQFLGEQTTSREIGRSQREGAQEDTAVGRQQRMHDCLTPWDRRGTLSDSSRTPNNIVTTGPEIPPRNPK